MDKFSVDQSSFFNPYSRYYGTGSLKDVAFNANLQKFAYRTSIIAGLHCNGKLSAMESWQQIEELMHQLEQSKQQFETSC